MVEAAGGDEIVLHPVELLARDRDLRIDVVVLDDNVIDIAGTRIVRLGLDDLAWERDGPRRDG